ncbi:unnamed protein product [Aspergillus oryzae]|nr:unnamed protein product [Aspergillus oryzae]GMF90999.1 unnamed protein product [Aspergillus oryzae]
MKCTEAKALWNRKGNMTDWLGRTDWDDTLGLIPYNSRFRAYRKALHQEMGTPASILKYHDIIDMETHRLLFRILENPEDLVQHIRKSVVQVSDYEPTTKESCIRLGKLGPLS